MTVIAAGRPGRARRPGRRGALRGGAADLPARAAGRRPGRRRRAGGDAGHPLDQDQRQGVGDRPGHPHGRPHHAGGRRHAGQGAGAVRQGAPPRPGRPDLPGRRRGLRLPVDGRRPRPRSCAGRGVHVASVATAFPSGQAPLPVKLDDTRAAVADGRRRDRHGDQPRARSSPGATWRSSRRSSRSSRPCGRRPHLKVILETGELATYDNVRRASWLAMLAGARLHQDLHRQGARRPPRCRSR